MNPLLLEIDRIKNYSTFIISVLDATVGVVSAIKILKAPLKKRRNSNNFRSFLTEDDNIITA